MEHNNQYLGRTSSRTAYGTRLCLSGAENRKVLEVFKDFGVKHIQVSYYYLRRVFSDPAEAEKFLLPFETVLIDSGTHYHRFKNEDDRKQFLVDYSGYVGALSKNTFTAAVYEKESFIEKVLEDGRLIYPLEDLVDSFDNSFVDIVRHIPYIGVSQIQAKKEDIMGPLYKAAISRGAYIHAFGTGSKRLLQKYPFYTANSSNWRSGSRYLNTYIYEGQTRGLRLYQPSDKSDPVKTDQETRRIRKRQYSIIKSKSPNIAPLIDTEALYEGEAIELDKANLSQWLLFCTDLENTATKAYWLSEEDKRNIIASKRALLGISTEARTEENPHTTSKAHSDNTPIEEGAYIEGDNKGEYIEQPPYIEGEAIEADSADKASNSNPNILPTLTPANNAGLSGVYVPLHPRDPRITTLRRCDDCSLSDRCPKYEEGGLCKFGLSPETPITPPDKMHVRARELESELIEAQYDRVMQLYLEEKLDAAGANKDLTKNIELLHRMIRESGASESVDIKMKGPGVLDIFKPKTRDH